MNNGVPFFNPFNQFHNIDYNNEFEKLINKIDRLEKSIRILENRVNKLENKKENNNQFHNDEPTDMYMI